jgi:hypothetical protein
MNQSLLDPLDFTTNSQLLFKLTGSSTVPPIMVNGNEYIYKIQVIRLVEFLTPTHRFKTAFLHNRCSTHLAKIHHIQSTFEPFGIHLLYASN